MRIALLADSHGFVPALEAGLAACRAAAPDLVLILGDILTCPYSPDPAGESIALAKGAGAPVLLGNHELLLRAHGTDEWEDAMAMRDVRATRPAGRWVAHMAVGKSLVAPKDLAWLHTLPSELTFDDGKVFASHGLPGNPFLSVDGIDPREGELGPVRAAAFARPEVAAAELILCAHNHVPLTTVQNRLTTVQNRQMVVRVAAACGWGAQRRQDERFGGYAVLTRRGLTWEVEHRTFPWRPRDPSWTWDASVAAEPRL